MKTLFTAAAAIALVVAAGPVSAQMYPYQPMNPPPMQTMQPPGYAPAPQSYSQPAYPQPAYPQPAYSQPGYTQPSYISGSPSWMQDDGSSSNHPIHNAGDHSASQLNTEYQNGLTVPAGTGLPAQPGQ